MQIVPDTPPPKDMTAGVVHISQIGAGRPETNAKGFFEFYRDPVLPKLRELA